MPFGDSLIKRVVEELRRDFPRLKTFVTLSPIPTYRTWLAKQTEELWDAIDQKLLKRFDATLKTHELRKDSFIQRSDALDIASATSSPEIDLLKELHLRFAARFLQQLDGDREPRDPVARFHLGNGARIEQLNWQADPSPKGMKQSYGIMVNYLYDLKKIDRARAGLAAGKVAVSAEIEHLGKD